MLLHTRYSSLYLSSIVCMCSKWLAVWTVSATDLLTRNDEIGLALPVRDRVASTKNQECFTSGAREILTNQQTTAATLLEHVFKDCMMHLNYISCTRKSCIEGFARPRTSPCALKNCYSGEQNPSLPKTSVTGGTLVPRFEAMNGHASGRVR